MHWEQMRNGDGQRSVEFRVVKDLSSGDGITNTSYLRATAFPELDEDGRMKSVTGIIMDWSAQKAQELAVVDRLAEALEAKRTQENFMGESLSASISSLAHIFQTWFRMRCEIRSQQCYNVQKKYRKHFLQSLLRRASMHCL